MKLIEFIPCKNILLISFFVFLFLRYFILSLSLVIRIVTIIAVKPIKIEIIEGSISANLFNVFSI
jgi:hypothetical protein